MLCTISDAIDLAQIIETVAPKHGFHTALTGGCLYKDGMRKDIDILLYKHNSEEGSADKQALLNNLKSAYGFIVDGDYGRVVKSRWDDRDVDLLFPGFEGEYSKANVLGLP